MTLTVQGAYHTHEAEGNIILEQYVPGPHYLGIAVKLPVIGISQYQGYNFNSMVKFGDVYLGASSHGIYTLDTKDTDQDAQIRAIMKTMTTDLGILNQKRLRKGYLGYETSGSLQLTVYDDDNNARTYTLTSTLVDQEQHSGEIPIGRDGKGRYWAFKIENVHGCDFSVDSLSVIPLFLTRKP
jgi:hypothetical protein